MNIDNLLEKVILGTVQLGIPYGINNATGKPKRDESLRILTEAKKNKIHYLDTADAYGDAPQIIGEFHKTSGVKFEIITKFSGLQENQGIEQKIDASLKVLEVDYLYAYLFHKPSDFLDNPALLKQLNAVKRQGLIKHAGISVYTNAELETAIRTEEIDLIQLPFNLLDNNNLRGELMQEAKQNNKIIHTRSAFLQGLFFKPADQLSGKVKLLEGHLNTVKEIAASQKTGMQKLALSYVMNNPLIDGVILGVDSLDHLLENINTIKEIAADQTDFSALVDQIVVTETEALNPGNWK